MPSWDLGFSKHPDGGALDLEIFKRKAWPGFAAHFARIAAPSTYRFKLKSKSNYIALHDLHRVDGETIVSGQPPSFAKDLRGKLAFIPAGCAVEGWARIEKPASIMVLLIDRVASSRLPAELAELPPSIEFEDPALRSLMLRFQAILDDRSLDIPGYAESLAELLTFELTRVAGDRRGANPAPSGLSPSQMRLITEYMDSRLNEKVTIAELAAQAGFTRFHFMRAFKQAAGVPPLQFMIRRRVDRAIELLAERNTSIADIANRTGFGSSIQMTRAFRRLVGTTPSAVRRSI